MKQFFKNLFHIGESKTKETQQEKKVERYEDTMNLKMSSDQDWNNSVFFYDFVGEMYTNPYGNPAHITISGGTMAGSDDMDMETQDPAIEQEVDKQPKKITKIAVKPIDVFKELERNVTNISLQGLEEKISFLKLKSGMIKQHYAKREVDAMTERLENRRKYENEVKDFYSRFDNTDDEAIKNLLSKYALEVHPSDLFIPEFPNDAIMIMDEYSKKTEEFFGKKPVFYVISDPQDFRDKYAKRDPILLVQSPFGFFWQILGVWGEEHMQLLSEL